MRVLYIHTYYRQLGGEDIVYENEKNLLEQNGLETRSVLFDNRKYAAIKFIFLLFNPVSFIRVYKQIGEFKPDVVHIHNWFFGASPSVFLAVKLRRVPLVHTLHNFRILCPSAFLFDKDKQFLDSLSRTFPFQAIKNRVYRNSFFLTLWLALCTRLHFFFRTWQRIDIMIALTNSAKHIICNSYLKTDPAKIAVKPNFFKIDNNSSITLDPALRSKNFLYVGRLAPEKGITLLLEAFQNSPFSIIIVGEGPLRGLVEKRAKEQANICYIGFKQKERIIQEMSKCNALVFPSIGYELFGLTIIEAFSCGTPIIASDSGSPAELVTENINGLHFEIGSLADFINKMNEWMEFPNETKRRFYENALETYKQHFTADHNFKQLSAIYNLLMDEKKSAHQLSN